MHANLQYEEQQLLERLHQRNKAAAVCVAPALRQRVIERRVRWTFGRRCAAALSTDAVAPD